jgi:kynureninase
MNANELAQEFEEYLKEIEELPWGNHQILCDQAAAMLRQQQAEIEELKAGKIRAYDNGVKDGRKPNTNLIKELTDDKIADLIKATNDEIGMKNIRTFDFTKVLLKKAQEK